MSNLVVIAYPDMNRAEQVLDTLKGLGAAHLIDLDDAVYITKDAQGKFKMHQSVNMAGVGAGSGAVWGGMWGLLFGALVFAPLAGLAIGAGIGAGTGALAGHFSDYGIDENFIKQLNQTMTPNSSAICVLVRNATPDKVLPEISKYGGTVIQTSLSTDAEDKLRAALTQQQTMPPPGMQQAPGANAPGPM